LFQKHKLNFEVCVSFVVRLACCFFSEEIWSQNCFHYHAAALRCQSHCPFPSITLDQRCWRTMWIQLCLCLFPRNSLTYRSAALLIMVMVLDNPCFTKNVNIQSQGGRCKQKVNICIFTRMFSRVCSVEAFHVRHGG
jgi:hypothetical protein